MTVAAPRSLESAIGAQIKKLRQEQELKIADLAKVAGLSIGMVSKIENGQTSASLSSLEAIATALNVPIAAFFQSFDEKREATFVKAGQGLSIERRGSKAGHLYQLLGHSVRSDVKIEPYLISLNETADAHPHFQHVGHEFIYMLQGDITYRHGGQIYRLQPGDSLFFDADAAHGPEAFQALPAIYLSIIVTPPKKA